MASSRASKQQPRKRAVKRGDTPDADAQMHPETDLFGFARTQPRDAVAFADNMLQASGLWQQICQKLSAAYLKEPLPAIGHADPLNIGDSFVKVAGKMASNPSRLMESQLRWWQQHLQLLQQTTEGMLGKAAQPAPAISDRRFEGEGWQENSYFDYLRRSYLLNSEWVQELVEQVPNLDTHTARKVGFFTRQFLDAISPSNFLLTNPQVMKATLESNGANLVRGLQHFLDDIDRGGGKLRISMTDEQAFHLGENIAATEGQVVYENDLMQLIQYAPTTKEVFATPLLVMPAWINKYYVLDLRPENSLIQWLVDQGHTVFVVSWVNPDSSLATKRFDDYLAEGPLAALDVIETITGARQTSVIGYCLGGTMTAILLAYLRAQGQEKRIASATYLTTMVDFSQAGELSVFIDEEQIQILEGRMKEKGYLDASEMSTTFNLLRSNDLIWSFVVNNYLMGKDSFAFDLLYWNADSTRMPATAHSFYLRNMYLHNLLVKPAGIELLSTPINITKIQTPSYILSTKDDHIAPWQSTYLATQIYDGPVRFVLAQSGHIAGVVNPPSKQRYGYWSNDALPLRDRDWLEGACFHEKTSWWPDWQQWQKAYAGKMQRPPALGGKHYPPLEPAPGRYAKSRS
jgi:polyhydroxyalkanoate synthase subunit PhaC